MADDVDAIFERLKRLAAEAGLPDVEESTSYGNPALKVGGKSFVAVKNAETIVISISLDDKDHLLEMAPDVYFQTDHYVGWPHLPVRPAVQRAWWSLAFSNRAGSTPSDGSQSVMTKR